MNLPQVVSMLLSRLSQCFHVHCKLPESSSTWMHVGPMASDRRKRFSLQQVYQPLPECQHANIVLHCGGNFIGILNSKILHSSSNPA
uniref:Uncharacterized protein n=1 Tax=Arundo donax TaxID=35708 RepID=A0A0A9B7A1_ARUDO